jgi:catechol 2,3-dioxygenase-like lactoylglutathione lyase family enzyme
MPHRRYGVAPQTETGEQPQRRKMTRIKIGHIALRAQDLEKTAAFYRDTLGFPEAFRMYDSAGIANNVHVFVGNDQFIEIFPNGTEAREVTEKTIGPVHICFEVDNALEKQEEIRGRGAVIDKSAAQGASKCINFWTHDPDGVSIEFSQLPPESLQAQAIARH